MSWQSIRKILGAFLSHRSTCPSANEKLLGMHARTPVVGNVEAPGCRPIAGRSVGGTSLGGALMRGQPFTVVAARTNARRGAYSGAKAGLTR